MYRLLVVDDEKDITESIKNGLSHHGFEVDAYVDPEIALSEFKPKKYALALLDITLPKLNGFDLFHEIKRQDSDIKICFLTALETHFSEFQHIFPNHPRQCFILKPITLNHLTRHIKSELKLR